MLDFIILLAPGALTFLTSEKLAARKDLKSHTAVMETILYSGLNMGLLWLIRTARGEASAAAALISQDGQSFWLSLLIALLLGIAAAIFHKLDMELSIVETGQNLLSGAKPWVRRSVVTVFFCVFAVSFVWFAFGPRISRTLTENRHARESVYMKKLYSDLKQTLSDEIRNGTVPEDLDTLTIDGQDVRRVYEDQKWNSGTGSKEKQAVYMIDGLGSLIYFSFRTVDAAGTWSGPSVDEAFSDWRGFGWTGSLK